MSTHGPEVYLIWYPQEQLRW